LVENIKVLRLKWSLNRQKIPLVCLTNGVGIQGIP